MERKKKKMKRKDLYLYVNKYRNKYIGVRNSRDILDPSYSELSKRFQRSILIFTPIVTRTNKRRKRKKKRQKLINSTVIPQGIKKGERKKEKRHRKRPRRNKRHIIRKRTIQLKNWYIITSQHPLNGKKKRKKRKRFPFHLQNTRTHVRKIR